MSAGMGMEFSLRETSNFLTIGPSPPFRHAQTVEYISCPRDFNPLPPGYSVNQQWCLNFYILPSFSPDGFFPLKYHNDVSKFRFLL